MTFSLAAVRTPIWNLVVSSVPGPQFPLYLAGAEMVAHYPVSVITDGMGLNITVMSYLGSLDFGIVADREQMPDVWSLIDWLREALDELLPEDAREQSQAEDDAPVEAAAAEPAAAQAPAEAEEPATG